MVGTTTRCSWQRTSSQNEIQTSLTPSAPLQQDRSERSLSLRLRQEIQAVMRRGGWGTDPQPEKTLSSTSAGELPEGEGSSLTLTASLAPKTRWTILEGVAARSICRMTLRYPFLHGTRNLDSKGTHAKPCGILNVMGFYSPRSRMFDHAVEERFLKTENRALVLARDQPADPIAGSGGVASGTR